MGQAAALTDTYPGTMNVDKGLLAEAIESCLDCFQVCTACADACLAEEDVKPLAKCKCIRDDLDCASILRRHHRGPVAAHRLRRQHHPRAAAGVPGRDEGVRGQLRRARRPPRTLPAV